MDGGGLGGLRWTAEEASTIGGIATVSLLHSFIPTHWLPFSIVARAQRWPLARVAERTSGSGVLADRSDSDGAGGNRGSGACSFRKQRSGGADVE